jgi:hypothetical protein
VSVTSSIAFATWTISRGIEIDLREMIDEDPAKIPAPLEAQHFTQT